jgi:hypothetical protein
MAENTYYAPNTTRPHWGGAASDIEQHIELYEGGVDTAFKYNQIFGSLSTQRSVANQSNTIRIDRLNSTTVKGRKALEAIDASKVTSDKMLVTVDTMLYIRNPIDYMDDITSPDVWNEMAANNGSEFAETFDTAHITQLIKARDWVAPAHLKPAFSDGIEIGAIANLAATTQAEAEAAAVALHAAHKAGVNEMIKRKVPLGDMITLVSVDVFSALIEHPKLLSLDISGGGNGSYGDRRVTKMNGVTIVESTAFPGVDAAPVLGAAFATTEADALCQMVTFSKSKTLVTVEAMGFKTNFWDDKREMTNVLDCTAMYTIACRRPDTCAVVSITAEAPVTPPVTP